MELEIQQCFHSTKSPQHSLSEQISYTKYGRMPLITRFESLIFPSEEGYTA